jgi:hypothetical protein
MEQPIEEELEVVAQKTNHCMTMGFYSSREISQLVELDQCNLHNQIIAITLLSERK